MFFTFLRLGRHFAATARIFSPLNSTGQAQESTPFYVFVPIRARMSFHHICPPCLSLSWLFVFCFQPIFCFPIQPKLNLFPFLPPLVTRPRRFRLIPRHWVFCFVICPFLWLDGGNAFFHPPFTSFAGVFRSPFHLFGENPRPLGAHFLVLLPSELFLLVSLSIRALSGPQMHAFPQGGPPLCGLPRYSQTYPMSRFLRSRFTILSRSTSFRQSVLVHNSSPPGFCNTLHTSVRPFPF